MTDLSLLPPMLGVGGLVAAIVIYFIVKSYDEGDDRLKRIADQIHLGAMVFMRREYTMLSIFAAVLLVVIYFSPLGLMTAAAFLAGALSSAAAGWFGPGRANAPSVSPPSVSPPHASPHWVPTTRRQNPDTTRTVQQWCESVRVGWVVRFPRTRAMNTRCMKKMGSNWEISVFSATARSLRKLLL